MAPKMEEFVKLEKSLAPSLPQSFYDQIPEPENKEHDSFYVFSLHKCASTMFQRMFTKIGNHNGIPNVAIDVFRFRENYKYTRSNKEEIKNLFLPKGYWYGVLRRLGLDQIGDLDCFDLTKKSILVVRDPRDVVTSQYYSEKYSHVAPGKTGKKLYGFFKRYRKSVDQHALTAARDVFLSRYNRYIDNLVPLHACKVYRYEDIIFDKSNFLKDAMEHLDLECPEDLLAEVVAKEDKLPQEENKKQHVRKVTPGDHKEKLKGETIEELNSILKKPLSFFNYG